jgi:RNA polymerase sigma-B factor
MTFFQKNPRLFKELRPLWPEPPYDWVTHEAAFNADEVAIAILARDSLALGTLQVVRVGEQQAVLVVRRLLAQPADLMAPVVHEPPDAREKAIDALDAMNAYATRSLHAPFDEGSDDNLSEKLGSPESGYEEVEDGELVAAGLDALDERERQIVELRFFHEMTQSQIASEIGISQMHVSRLLRRALGTMRGRIEEVSVE